MSTRRKGKVEKVEEREMEPVEVFCRLRPVNPPGSVECAVQLGDREVELVPPESALAKNALAKPTINSFTEVIGPETEQSHVFERVCGSLVEDLVAGKNGLLFAYGITGSGKTFTMTGHPQATGILPRALDVLFNSITELLAPSCVFFPDGYNRFNVRSEGAATLAQKDASRRGRAQGQTSVKPTGRRKREAEGGSDWEMVPREREEGRVAEVDEDNGYAVFVSYVEIYNNYAYDLLDPALKEGTDGAAKMASKGLRDDATKMTYVQDLTEVEVRSTDEAFQLFIAGQQNRRVAQTALNAVSSRSHSVFNVRLVQAPLDSSGSQLLQDKGKVHVSQLSLVDLAGSERSNRTGNSGDRMAESGHINGSLMTLRRCIEALRERQQRGVEQLVPYRESRLTHLFKNFFEGKGKVRMVVCVNPSSGDYEENLHVMQFAEMTQEVEVARAQELDYGTLFPGLAPGRRRAAKYQAAVEAELASRRPLTDLPSGRNIFDALPRLRHDSRFGSDSVHQLRAAILARSHRRKDFGHACVSSAETGLQKLNLYVRHAETNRRALDELETEVPNLEKENGNLRAQDRLHRREIQDLRSRVAKYESEDTLRGASERSARKKAKELESTVKAQQVKFAEMRDALAGPSSVPASPAAQSKSLPRRQQSSSRSSSSTRHTNNKAATVGLPRVMPKPSRTGGGLYPRLPVIPGTPAGSSTDENRPGRSRARREEPATPLRKEGGGTPTVDPRTRRRSKSLTIHHEPAHKVPGAALTSDFKGARTRRTSRPRSGDLAQASDYALTHQELDGQGNVRTSLYKADVHPTLAGGSAVVFHDVEELSHRDLGKRSSPEDRKDSKKRRH